MSRAHKIGWTLMAISIGLMVYGIMLLASCSKVPMPPVHRSVVFIDRTDSVRLSVCIDDLDLRYKDRLKQGRSVTVRPITDVATEGRIVLELVPYEGQPLFEGHMDEDWRQNHIREFEDSLQSVFDQIAKKPTGFDHTQYLRPFIDELRMLMSYPSDERYVLVFGDVGEFNAISDWVGESETRTINRLARDDRSVWDGLDGVSDLDLNGISITFVYTPTAEREGGYLIRVHYLKRRLEELGAAVTIRGSINRISVGS